MKRLILCMIAGFIMALLCIQAYDLWLDPNNNFFERCAKTSDAWNQRLRSASSEPCYVIAGGSEIRMGIDPALLGDEYGLRVINAAGGAGFGLHVNARLGLEYLRRGDSLILSLAGTQMSDDDYTTSGLKFAWRRLGPRMFNESLTPCHFSQAKELLHGSAGSMSMFLCKLICTPHQMYKYDANSIIHQSGWCELFYDEMAHEPAWDPPCPPDLSAMAQTNKAMDQFLADLQQACRQRGVRLMIYMAPACQADGMRSKNAMAALTLTRRGIPVIKTPALGCEPDNRLFADTHSHLNANGVIKHNRILGEALRNESFWTEEELVRFLHSRGWGPHGERLIEHVIW